MLNGLSLFSGIGGIDLGLGAWVRPVAYCEIDSYAQAVLLNRMADGLLPRAPIWPDVRTLPVRELPPVDIVYGGFPCQDLSVAGSGKGLEGRRSGLVFDLLRIVGECRPRYVFLENVPALAVRGLDRLLLELHALGYDARWTIVSAAEVGAPHLRERLWILASDAGGERVRVEQQRMPARRPPGGVRDKGQAEPLHDGKEEPMAHADGLRESQRAEGRDGSRIRTADRSEALADSEVAGLPRCGGGTAEMRRKSPDLNAMVRLPTPRASDGAKGGPNQALHGQPSLASIAASSSETTGQLSPMWCEWLMGYPIGWTALGASATEWFRKQRAKRTRDSRGSGGSHESN